MSKARRGTRPRRAREAQPRDGDATRVHAQMLAQTKRTQFWLVASDIECAALMYGEVSPALRAQAANLLEPKPYDLHEER